MFLADPQSTPFDLQFWIGRIPVRVHPLFWLIMALLGWDPDDLRATLIWTLCGFVSILAHELGHAFTAQYFGHRPHIVLYAFGGFASYESVWRQSAWRSIAITAAGPAVSFLTGGLALGTWFLLAKYHAWPADQERAELLGLVLWFLIQQGIGWGIFNCIPIYPLDGGRIVRHLAEHFAPIRGRDLSLKLSLALAAIITVYSFQHGGTFLGLMFLQIGFMNWQELQGPWRSYR